MAVAGMVLGVVAILLSLVPCIGVVAIGPGVLAIIFAAIAMARSKTTGEGRSMATAGIVCGIIACVWPLMWPLIFVAAAAEGGAMVQEMNRQMQQVETEPPPASEALPAERTD